MKEETKKFREFELNMTSEREFKRASAGIPLEIHIELLKHAYDANNYTVFYDLAATADTRCRLRRLEVPYIVDLDILMSSIPNSNIPNGYEKIPIDINEAHLKSEMARMRLLMAKEIAKQQEEKRIDGLNTKKRSKLPDKGGKNDAKAGGDAHDQGDEVDPSMVTHNYIYFIVKRSPNPDKAIYAIDVVMADEDRGPVDMISNGWRAIAIPLNQYTGVRETTRQIPYLCLRHSLESLRDDEEKKSLLIDFLPILSKSYLMRPPYGFERLNLDIRQVPQQFYKIANLDFAFLTIK